MNTIVSRFTSGPGKSALHIYTRFISMVSTKKPIDTVNMAKINLFIRPSYEPRGSNQKAYVQLLQDTDVDILVTVGPTGTGKTLFACAAAFRELQTGSVQRILFTYPNGPANIDIQHRPFFDILSDFYGTLNRDSMLRTNVIETYPIEYMKGRTYTSTFIIADEMQHSSVEQMFTVASRLGKNSRLVIIGDNSRSGEDKDDNGLRDIVGKIEKNGIIQPFDSIRLVKMGRHDIQRSAIVSKIHTLYKKKNDIEPHPSSPVTHSPYSVFSLKK